MSNPAFPDLLKIGKSKKDPTQDRVSELNQTGVPEPFRVEYYAFVENEDALETLAHKHFSAKRPNKKREFFSVDCAVAINTIRDLAMRHSSIKFEEVFYVSPEELQAQRLDQEAKELAKAEAIKAERKRRWDMEAKARQEREEAEKIEAERQAALTKAESERQAALRISEKKKARPWIVFHLVGIAASSLWVWSSGEEGDLLFFAIFSSVYLGALLWGILIGIFLGLASLMKTTFTKAKASYKKAIQIYRRIITKEQ
jgi:hypothetical protein